jgi:hypothetical protein
MAATPNRPNPAPGATTAATIPDLVRLVGLRRRQRTSTRLMRSSQRYVGQAMRRILHTIMCAVVLRLAMWVTSFLTIICPSRPGDGPSVWRTRGSTNPNSRFDEFEGFGLDQIDLSLSGRLTAR